ncbi:MULTISPECIES: hypothetical protein [Aerosakkonema]|uniref:hypothetical protein n=1 Tax=Aerosakkonema TaxID=1246629 RepID=UPI0035BA12D6
MVTAVCQVVKQEIAQEILGYLNAIGLRGCGRDPTQSKIIALLFDRLQPGSERWHKTQDFLSKCFALPSV